jgi:hypothetical protein
MVCGWELPQCGGVGQPSRGGGAGRNSAAGRAPRLALATHTGAGTGAGGRRKRRPLGTGHCSRAGQRRRCEGCWAAGTGTAAARVQGPHGCGPCKAASCGAAVPAFSSSQTPRTQANAGLVARAAAMRPTGRSHAARTAPLHALGHCRAQHRCTHGATACAGPLQHSHAARTAPPLGAHAQPRCRTQRTRRCTGHRPRSHATRPGAHTWRQRKCQGRSHAAHARQPAVAQGCRRSLRRKRHVLQQTPASLQGPQPCGPRGTAPLLARRHTWPPHAQPRCRAQRHRRCTGARAAGPGRRARHPHLATTCTAPLPGTAPPQGTCCGRPAPRTARQSAKTTQFTPTPATTSALKNPCCLLRRIH